MVYNAAYKTIPASLFSKPSIANSTPACSKPPIHLTKIKTMIITAKKEAKGNQRMPMFVLLCNHPDTTTENLTAAARPIKIARKENLQ